MYGNATYRDLGQRYQYASRSRICHFLSPDFRLFSEKPTFSTATGIITTYLRMRRIPRIVGDKRPPAARMDASRLRGTDVSQYKQYAGQLRAFAPSQLISLIPSCLCNSARTSALSFFDKLFAHSVSCFIIPCAVLGILNVNVVIGSLLLRPALVL